MPNTNIGETDKCCTYFVYKIIISGNHWLIKVTVKRVLKKINKYC